MAYSLKKDKVFSFEFDVKDLLAWLIAGLFTLASVASFIQGQISYSLLIFQLFLSGTLALTFFTDKYTQINLILFSITYIIFFWFLKSYLIIENLPGLFSITDVVLLSNWVLIGSISLLLALLFSSLLFYDYKLTAACAVMILIYSILVSIFSAFQYYQDVLEISFWSRPNFAEFFIIFYQFFTLELIIFSFLYGIIMVFSHTIHLKMIPKLKSLEGK